MCQAASTGFSPGRSRSVEPSRDDDNGTALRFGVRRALGVRSLSRARGPAAAASLTRFAPAPTGALHLGHVVNAVYVWGLAAALGGRVLLRIEDHDRQRARAEAESQMLDDLDWLGFAPDIHPTDAYRRGSCEGRQSERDAIYRTALAPLVAAGLCLRVPLHQGEPSRRAHAGLRPRRTPLSGDLPRFGNPSARRRRMAAEARARARAVR